MRQNRPTTENDCIAVIRNVGGQIEVRRTGDVEYYIVRPGHDRPFGLKVLGKVDRLLRTGKYFFVNESN